MEPFPSGAILKTSPLVRHIDSFLQYLVVHRRLSKNTVDSYASDLHYILVHTEHRADHQPSELKCLIGSAVCIVAGITVTPGRA
ncbi:MAG: hypothetical protein D3903_14125 [Candidatus Electrothrix sp. GM3_4]|nr:hypothetical protein [Candidatus Electrothrix sp. GM3_4]